ncbi:MAG: hypothetical protein R3C26_12265 [Calditrichia bacterium]
MIVSGMLNGSSAPLASIQRRCFFTCASISEMKDIPRFGFGQLRWKTMVISGAFTKSLSKASLIFRSFPLPPMQTTRIPVD